MAKYVSLGGVEVFGEISPIDKSVLGVFHFETVMTFSKM
jgi:hypothetical protein